MISIKNIKDGQYGKKFTVVTTEGVEIHGCKIMSGKNGDFVSPPCRKDERTGKYINHAYFTKDISSQIIALVNGGDGDGYPKESDYAKSDEPTFNADDEIPF